MNNKDLISKIKKDTNINIKDVWQGIEKGAKEDKKIILDFKSPKNYTIIKLGALVACFVIICAFVISTVKIFNTIKSVNILENDTATNTLSSSVKIEEKDIIIKSVGNLDMLFNISDREVLNGLVDTIIIGKVTDIIGGTNYNPAKKVYTGICTVGKIEVIETFKGTLKANEIIPFVRGGGVISIYEYEKGLYEAQKIKQGIDKLSLEEKKTKYAEHHDQGDIQIEEGKTYLMYMKYDPENKTYGFQGFQYGLREFDPITRKIMNNDTNVWEELGNP